MCFESIINISFFFSKVLIFGSKYDMICVKQYYCSISEEINMALTEKDKQMKTAELVAYIEETKNIDGPLMPVMQKAQELFGYLSIETQELIADSLGIPMTEVYGVATFYSQFSLNPKGEYVISVCTGTACYVKGAQAVLDKVIEILGINVGETTPDGKFSIQDTRCLGCCGLAPVMMINDEVYGRLTPADIKGILDKYQDA